ncbi:MAG TPA: ATP-dependent DNA ligase [Actinobacteria bacterium]|nr:ATP-dependent DNA ligase [Actinomycetota bacterium]
MVDDKLSDYKSKRNFSTSPEPRESSDRAANSFVVQRHDASHLHFDFRLEMGGVLKSWAVPKGPPSTPKEKRLAIAVEDHPLSYGSFEGVIPEGQYGAGTVQIWDKGTFEPVNSGDPQDQLKKGKFTFVLTGERLNGVFSLVKTHFSAKSWLLIMSKE